MEKNKVLKNIKKLINFCKCGQDIKEVNFLYNISCSPQYEKAEKYALKHGITQKEFDNCNNLR